MNDKVFNPSVILPPDLVISSAGTHLYRMGLSLYPKCSESSPKLYNPLLIFNVIHRLENFEPESDEPRLKKMRARA
jgi:hypothetical protein